MNEIDEQIKKRVIDQMTLQKIEQVDIANHFELSAGAISKWFSKQIPKKRLRDIANFLKCDYEYLLGINVVREPIRAYSIKPVLDKSDLDNHDIMINVYNLKLSAGNGSVVPEFIETDKQLSFSLDWIERKNYKSEKLKLMKVTGDSMSESFNDGDMVLVNTEQDNIIDGKVYALMVGEDAKIKRLKRMFNGGLEIISDNKSGLYDTEIIKPEEMQYIFIIGRVVHKSGDVD